MTRRGLVVLAVMADGREVELRRLEWYGLADAIDRCRTAAEGYRHSRSIVAVRAEDERTRDPVFTTPAGKRGG